MTVRAMTHSALSPIDYPAAEKDLRCQNLLLSSLLCCKLVFSPVHGFQKRDKAEDVLHLEESDNDGYAYNTMPCSKWQYDVPSDAQSIADMHK